MRKVVSGLMVLSFMLVAWVSVAQANDTEKLVGLFEHFAGIIDSNAGDCDKMGAALEVFVAEKGGEMQALMKKMEQMSEEAQADAQLLYAARMEGAAEKMMVGLMQCIDNAAVIKSMEALSAEE